MKFGKALSQLCVPEWKKKYVDYKALKKIIKVLVKKLSSYTKADKENADFHNKIISECVKVNHFYKKFEHTYLEKHKQLEFQLFLMKKDETNDKEKRDNLAQAFSEHYRALTILRDFRELNHTAFSKALKKYDKYLHEYLEIINGSDRPLREYYMEYIDRAYFVHSGVVDFLLKKTRHHMINDLCDGNKKLAGEKLENWSDEKNVESAICSTGLTSGIALTLTLLSIYFYFKNYIFIQDKIPYSSISILLYKAAFLPILLLLLNSVNILIWKKYNINYVYIFNLNPKTKLNPFRFVEMSLIVYDIWIFSVFLYMYLVVEDYQKEINIGGLAWIVPLLMYVFYILWFILPLKIFYRSTRYWFINTVVRIAISPFVEVQFRDFYIGDQFTSLGEFFFNLQFIVCLYPITASNDDSCNNYMALGIPILNLWPHTMRFLQCVRRFRDSKQWNPHIINAGKYLSSILVILAAFLDSRIVSAGHPYGEWNWIKVIYVLLNVVSTIYKLLYDYYVDWGLFRIKGVRYMFLRQEMTFKPFWYYLAIVVNLILRFAWVPLIFILIFVGEDIKSRGGLIWIDVVMGSIEIFRRFIWNIFRLDNEQLNNAGEYLAIRDIPLPFETSHFKPKRNFLSEFIKTIEHKWPFKFLQSVTSQEEDNVLFHEVVHPRNPQIKEVQYLVIDGQRIPIVIGKNIELTKDEKNDSLMSTVVERLETGKDEDLLKLVEDKSHEQILKIEEITNKIEEIEHQHELEEKKDK